MFCALLCLLVVWCCVVLLRLLCVYGFVCVCLHWLWCGRVLISIKCCFCFICFVLFDVVFRLLFVCLVHMVRLPVVWVLCCVVVSIICLLVCV